VDGPVEGELQGAAVERAGHCVRCARIGLDCWWCCSQDLGFGSHGRGGAGRRGLPMGLEGRLGHVLVSAVWLDAHAGYSHWVCGDSLPYPQQQGLRRNTAAMLELRCCCRGMRYGCFRWWRRTRRPACKRTASYGGARTGVASFCSVDLRERA
jgi:hypothetical protein